jgi:hypothetical protein
MIAIPPNAGKKRIEELRQARGGPLTCSFCGKPERDVVSLIAGLDAFICDECIGLCVTMLLTDIPRERKRIQSERAEAWDKR